MADNGINGGVIADGVIAVNKPAGWTSFDVVAKLRGVLHTKKIGHGGTLDPMAEGVLPVFVGRATKACDILPDVKKGYKAGFRLGLVTDTQDITGKVLSESSKAVTSEELKAAAEKFVGRIMQVPPMYSAVKVDGKKLYQLAREGKTIEREARPITVLSLNIDDYDADKREGTMTVMCEKGTYIRTIINDIGEVLGCGGVMTSLVRTYSAGLALEDCLTIEEIQQRVDEGGAESVLKPLDRCFEVYEAVTLDEKLTRLYKNGVKLRAGQVSLDGREEAVYRVYGADGGFLGLGRLADGEFRSFKNFFV